MPKDFKNNIDNFPDEKKLLPPCLFEDFINPDNFQGREIPLKNGYKTYGHMYRDLLSTPESKDLVTLLTGITGRYNPIIIQEAITSKALNIRHTLKYLGITVLRTLKEDLVTIVREKYEYDLRQRLDSTEYISVRKQLEWAREIAHGLYAIHKRGYTHGNLKSTAIYFLKKDKIKIGDLEEACLIGEPDHLKLSKALNQLYSNSAWMAPELFPESNDKPSHTVNSDVYSLGMVFYEILTRRILYKGLSNQKIILQKKQGKTLPIPEKGAYLLKSLIQECWHATPTSRPSLQTICDKLDAILLLDLQQDEHINFLSDYSLINTSPSFYKKIKQSGILNHIIPETKLQIAYLKKNMINETSASCIYQGMLETKTGVTEIVAKIARNRDNLSLLKEAIALHNLQPSPYIMEFFGIKLSDEDGAVEMITKRYQSDLRTFLKSFRKKPESLSLEKKLKLMQQICCGLEFIHINKLLIHRDIKSRNIFMDHGNAVIGDFGDCYSIATLSKQQGSTGTRQYMAPELFFNNVNTTASDIFSFGMVCWEIDTCQTPFKDVDAKQLKYNKKNYVNPPLKTHSLFNDIILDCWKKEPTERPPIDYLHGKFDFLLKELNQPAFDRRTLDFNFGKEEKEIITDNNKTYIQEKASVTNVGFFKHTISDDKNKPTLLTSTMKMSF